MKRRLLGVGIVGGALVSAVARLPDAEAGSAQPVDIILAVGAPAGSADCEPSSEAACDLVRVRINLGATTASDVVTLVRHDERGEAGSGPSEQAISPDGTKMVWLERVGHSSQLWAQELAGGGKDHLLVKSGPAKEGGAGMRPEWPAWLDNNTLLFDAKSGDSDGVEQKTIYSMDVSALGNPGTPVARIGSGRTPGLGLQDPAVFPGTDGAQVVTFGPVASGGKMLYPLSIQTLTPGGKPKAGETRPALGTNASGKAIDACHHPAWNQTGDKILCMVHQPMEKVGGIDTRLLYTYARKSGEWNAAGRTFEPLTPEAAGMDVASLLTAAAGCKVITYKYAQYCQSDDYVVATLFCAKEGNASGHGAVIDASRVVLVHTNPVQYVDVTSLVERSRSLPAGTLSSFTATCRDAR